ncbi:hypothetical protein V8C42DRAFT_324002 [Trichoderma barbatum]
MWSSIVSVVMLLKLRHCVHSRHDDVSHVSTSHASRGDGHPRSAFFLWRHLAKSHNHIHGLSPLNLIQPTLSPPNQEYPST